MIVVNTHKCSLNVDQTNNLLTTSCYPILTRYEDLLLCGFNFQQQGDFKEYIPGKKALFQLTTPKKALPQFELNQKGDCGHLL